MKQENIAKEEFIRVGTTLYKLVNQPRLNGGYVKRHYGRITASTISPPCRSMTVSAPYPNTSVINPWSASSSTSTSR